MIKKIKQKVNGEHKATIETIINSAAIVLSAAGTNMLLSKEIFGFALVLFAAALEYLKYSGRKKNLW